MGCATARLINWPSSRQPGRRLALPKAGDSLCVILGWRRLLVDFRATSSSERGVEAPCRCGFSIPLAEFEMAAYMQAEGSKWEQVIKTVGITLE